MITVLAEGKQLRWFPFQPDFWYFESWRESNGSDPGEKKMILLQQIQLLMTISLCIEELVEVAV